MCFPVKSCCCCIRLKIGTQLISVVSTLLSTFIAMVYGFAAILPDLPASKMTFYGLTAVTATGHSIAGFLLMYAAFQKRPRYMWPWIVVSCFWSLLLLLATITGFVLFRYVKEDVGLEVNIVMTTYMLYAGLLYYFAAVVNSWRHELNTQGVHFAVKMRDKPQAGYKHVWSYSSWRQVQIDSSPEERTHWTSLVIESEKFNSS